MPAQVVSKIGVIKSVNKRILIFLISFLPQTACSVCAQSNNSYQTDWNSRHSQFSINDQDVPLSSPMMVNTTTSHHRFGSETGIGSSTMQTQSATSESMPRQTYQPTSVSPSLSSRPSLNPALGEIHLYNPAMTSSPAFSTTMEMPRSYEVQTQGFSDLSSPSKFSDIHFSRKRGYGFGSELLDPLKGL